MDWQWAPEPLLWEFTATPGSNYPMTDELKAGAHLTAPDAEKTPPKVLPGTFQFVYRTYGAVDSKTAWQAFQKDYREGLGVPVGDGGFTVKEQEYNFCMDIQKTAISPNPSYQMVIYDLDPMAAGAFATADQRWLEALPAIIGAGTIEAFEKEYKALLDRLVKITNWKPVFEKKQKAWLDWLAFNKIDDRPRLQTVTAQPEWQAIMGW